MAARVLTVALSFQRRRLTPDEAAGQMRRATTSLSRRGDAYSQALMAKILLVEDNEMNRDMLSRRLRRRDHQVEIAADGQEALDQVVAVEPDVVLLDMDLPVIDGWEVARRIKAEEKTASIPVIALTAHAMVGDREKALAAGCDDYDTKPIEFRRLLEKIDRALTGSE